MPRSDNYGLRWAVGKWLRARAADPTTQHQRGPLKIALAELSYSGDFDQAVAKLYTQLAADAEHSGLLPRLFDGEDLDAED